MDKHACEQTDREMSKRVDAVYGDPARHQFYSEFDRNNDEDRRGSRGGKAKGRKTICAYCGTKAKGHAAFTEAFLNLFLNTITGPVLLLRIGPFLFHSKAKLPSISKPGNARPRPN